MTGEVRGGHALARVAAGPGQAGPAVDAHRGPPVAGNPERTPPAVRDAVLAQDREERLEGASHGLEGRLVRCEAVADPGSVEIRAACAEGQPVVGRALAVDHDPPRIGEGLAVGESDLLPRHLGQGLGGDHHRVHREQLAPVPREGLGVRLRGAHDRLRAQPPGARDHAARLERERRRALVDRHAATLDDFRQPSRQPRRVDRRAVGKEKAAEVAGRAHPCRALVGLQPAEVLLTEAQRPPVLDVAAQQLAMRLRRRQRYGAPLRVVAVDFLALADAPYLVDGVEQGALQPNRALPARRIVEVVLDSGEDPQTPASVAA